MEKGIVTPSISYWFVVIVLLSAMMIISGTIVLSIQWILLVDLIPPCLHRTDYYYIFRWNEYLEKYPRSHRNIMMGELQEEWNALSQEERYPFEILAEEDEKQFKSAMKRVDSK